MRKLSVLILIVVQSWSFWVGQCDGGNDTLVVAMKTRFESLSPARSTTRQTLVLSHNWGDTLIYRDPKQKELVPCLAESYRLVGTNTIEFKLRQGIKFHNGEALNAPAVKFSLELLKQPDSQIASYLNEIREAIVHNEYTLSIISSIPNRIALEVLANLLVVLPPAYCQQVKTEGFGRHPIGTGPYQFVSWKKTDEIVFRANPHYFGGPKGNAIIPYLKIVIIPEEVIGIEALITGKVDLLKSGSVSPEQLLYLKGDPHLRIRKADILRHHFLIMDSLGQSGVRYFLDRRVRRAVNHAVDKEAIVSTVLSGYANVNHSVTTPLHFGHEPDVMTYPYDPAKAKRLLAEAGYPGGFTVDFCGYRDETVFEAIAGYLNAVGIKTNLIWMGGKWDFLYEMLLAGKVPLAFINWGSYSIFDASAIMNRYFMLDDPLCHGSTPAISAILKEANRSGSQEERKSLYSGALKRIAEEAYWVPLFNGHSITAMNKVVNFEPSYDEIDRFFTASWGE